MPACHPLPRIWLVTDERQGERLLPAVSRLPRGAGILFRHYSLPPSERRALFDQLRGAAQPNQVTILLAGEAETARSWGADGWHGWDKGAGLHSASVHNLSEIRRAEAQSAAILFLGPVFATRSHPGGRTLGPRGFASLAAKARRPVIALGGMNPVSGTKLARLGAYGWAAIDAWTS